MPVKANNSARFFVAGRKDAAKKFAFIAATLIKNRAQEYVPLDTGALQNSVTVKRSDDAGSMVTTATIAYVQPYALPLHSPKPGGKMDGWQPQTPEDRAMRMSAKNYPASGMSGGFNPSARQGWLFIGAEEAKEAVQAAFQDTMRL